MIYNCIGKILKAAHNGDRPQIISCPNTSPEPSVALHPEWGYLCYDCVNGLTEGFNTATTKETRLPRAPRNQTNPL